MCGAASPLPCDPLVQAKLIKAVHQSMSEPGYQPLLTDSKTARSGVAGIEPSST